MASWLWRARIDTVSGMTLGAGFLVTAGRLLTCAHNVAGLTEVRVTFPGGPADLSAAVKGLTSWANPGDVGDMALLELATPVAVPAARFAVPAARFWDGPLQACGFRGGKEKSGSVVTLRTSPGMELAQEWWQVDVDHGSAETLGKGFSGAAVYRAATGEVIGMLTDAVLGDGRMGRMLPLPTLRAHWEDLDELLTLPWLPDTEVRALRDIVRDAELPMNRIYEETFPGKPPGHEFRSAWDAIRYVAEELLGEDDGLERFLGALTSELPRRSADELARWTLRLKPAKWSHVAAGAKASVTTETERPAQREMTSIIVRLERRTRRDLYELSLATIVNGAPGLKMTATEVSAGGVRAEVEKRLAVLVAEVIGHDWMIEFALPEPWLSRPVEEWHAGETLMLTYPVVVRDVERLKPAFRQDRAIRRWSVLRGRAASQPERVGCHDSRTKSEFFYWLASREDVCVLVHAQRPSRVQLNGALNAGVPVMLWPRSVCAGPVHVDCAGQRMVNELAGFVAQTHPDDLPWLVRKLRVEALARADAKDTHHCGRRLTIFWDDPARLPDPPLAMPF
jgi:vWA-MoxR associated protein C-terminal domain/Trypsin-like peptidase domain